MFEGINFLSVIAATVSTMIIGFLWYTNILFGKPWANAVGLKPEEMDKKEAVKGHIYTLIGSFIAYTALAKIIVATHHFGALKGFLAGLILSFAFIVTTLFSNNTYERRPLMLTLIDSGYRLVCFAVAGLIIGIWQ